MAKNTQTIPEDMHWTGHLGELRKRLFISLGVFIVFLDLDFISQKISTFTLKAMYLSS